MSGKHARWSGLEQEQQFNEQEAQRRQYELEQRQNNRLLDLENRNTWNDPLYPQPNPHPYEDPYQDPYRPADPYGAR